MYCKEDITKRLKKLREGVDKTQKQVAKELNISIETIRKIEQGRNDLSMNMLIGFADCYHTSTDYILRGIPYLPDEVDGLFAELSEIEKLRAIKILKGILKELAE